LRDKNAKTTFQEEVNIPFGQGPSGQAFILTHDLMEE
jgi:hypothetical protein